MIRNLALLGIVLISSQGCAAAALPLIAPVAGGAFTKSVEFVGGTVYRTYVMPSEQLETLVREVLFRMEFPTKDEEWSAAGAKITATAEQSARMIEVNLERVTPATTRLGVVVWHHGLTKDRATAAEIISQTDRVVEETLERTRPHPSASPASRRGGSPH